MISKTIGYNLKIAVEAILANKLRSLLTSLGIIFGVSSVIAMLAVGKGAEQEVLEKMKILGANNIIINPISRAKLKEAEEKAEESEDTKEEKNTGGFSQGLTIKDAKAILNFIPEVQAISPEIISEVMAISNGFKLNTKLVGIENEHFKVNMFEIENGAEFSNIQTENSSSVCIIGAGAALKLFPAENPIGKKLKAGNEWLEVIGVLKNKNISETNQQNLGIRNYDIDIYIPINTMLMRFLNREKILKTDLKQGRRQNKEKADNYHQLDRLIVKLKDNSRMNEISDVISRMLFRRHNSVRDFEIIIPELLLEQEQSTKRIFNIVLGAIASISLIIGGIGIMNIMLASVLERTKEIGIRKAVGATGSDILLQFLFESVLISLSGGVFGIILGVTAAQIIELSTDISTIVSPVSVFISFLVSISVGLIFGITPAQRASKQNPIDLLRYE